MNKELILALMTNSFKQANIKLAVENGIEQSLAIQHVDAMNSSVEKCMSQVLEDLLDNFPNFIK